MGNEDSVKMLSFLMWFFSPKSRVFIISWLHENSTILNGKDLMKSGGTLLRMIILWLRLQVNQNQNISPFKVHVQPKIEGFTFGDMNLTWPPKWTNDCLYILLSSCACSFMGAESEIVYGNTFYPKRFLDPIEVHTVATKTYFISFK